MKTYLSLIFALFSSLLLLSSCSSNKKLERLRKAEIQTIYTELSSEIKGIEIVVEDENRVKITFPSTSLFEVNSSIIQDDFKPVFVRLATVLNKHPKTSILVTGYTDTSGSDELNNKLSWQRAESAKAELLTNSVKNKRVYTWGFGSKNPIASNETPEGRKLNRRVEIIVLHDFQGQKK